MSKALPGVITVAVTDWSGTGAEQHLASKELVRADVKQKPSSKPKQNCSWCSIKYSSPPCGSAFSLPWGGHWRTEPPTNLWLQILLRCWPMR